MDFVKVQSSSNIPNAVIQKNHVKGKWSIKSPSLDSHIRRRRIYARGEVTTPALKLR